MSSEWFDLQFIENMYNGCLWIEGELDYLNRF